MRVKTQKERDALAREERERARSKNIDPARLIR